MTETWNDAHEQKRRSSKNYPVDGFHNQFDRDRARIVHSYPFRRLQGKTQVLGIAEGDFHRTRMTHSNEVAQIARGIVIHLQKGDPALQEEPDLLNPDLIEAIAFAHDLGHPPFGHAGEAALNEVMKEKGFEGNGQTLRIL